MLILALDTCDTRGSLALLRDSQVLCTLRHETDEDYSAWLLPAVKHVLQTRQVEMANVELLSVAAGPGSFTALRVGLTSVKAWAEVYDISICGVSRLEAIASFAPSEAPWIAAFADAHREQVFGALFRREGELLTREGDEAVERPEEFVKWVEGRLRGQPVAWASLDPQAMAMHPGWSGAAPRSGEIVQAPAELAVRIGELGRRKFERGEVTDALRLEANYVRRSDAELFWKGSAAHGK